MAVNYERGRVYREVATLDLDYSSIDAAIEELQNIRRDHGAERSKLRIQRQSYDYSDGEYWAVMGERDETDKEMRKRITDEERWEAEQAERDRRDFERLKAKFGG
jgi:hypothetical protein